ncbi:MAG: hypothetical protein PSN34_15735 [Urechidicola sp.]|nr:hypothetical protein [Urechidicola sp.]
MKKILEEICKEINTEETKHFILYKDGAFSINQYSFTDYDDIVDLQTTEITELEELFNNFCETSELKIKNSESIFKFIEKNKFTLSKYISHSKESNGQNYTAEAQFVDFFKKIPQIYERIKSIYIGSIIAGYIEYNSEGAKREIILLLDTNFIVGLIDLNTPESTHTCRTLIKIAKQQDFKIRILIDTIEETKNLLQAKADYFDKSFLQKKVNQEDVYNACDRRKINKTDLERIADNLEQTINDFKINVLHSTDKLKKEAKFTEVYQIFKKVRRSEKSALHDSTAILYITKQRKKRIKDFDKVNAWFVNNSASVQGDSIFLKNGYQPETIKAGDLLNILWLSNPQVNESIKSDDLADIGLTSVISSTLNKNLPKSQIIRELDDNIHKYAKEEISDTDVIRVATRITNNQLKNIEELNQLAIDDKTEFVRRLEEEAKKQKQIEESRIEKLEKIFKSISIRTDELEKTKNEFKEKSKNIDTILKEKDNKETHLENRLLEEQNRNREILRDNWYSIKVREWRRKTWIEFSILLILMFVGILYIFYQSNWNFDNSITLFKELKGNVIFSSILSIILFILNFLTLKTLYSKYRSYSNIVNFKKDLKVPENMRELKKAST